MSHGSRGQNLSEWADLIGASLPDSVDDLEDGATGSDAYPGSDTIEAAGYEFGTDTEPNG